MSRGFYHQPVGPLKRLNIWVRPWQCAIVLLTASDRAKLSHGTLVTLFMDAEEAKQFVIGTCETPFTMDMHDLKAGLSKWGFKVVDSEILYDPANLEALPLYLVWLECDYGYNLARENVKNWLHDMREFPWTGSWTFVLRFWYTPDLTKEFEFRVTKYFGNVWKISGLTDAKPRWPTTRFTRIRGEIYSVDEVHGLSKEELSMLPPGTSVVFEDL